jgi:hypothetical protein
MDVFQEAVKAAQRRHGEAWLLLSPPEQTRCIYQEMRRIDAELAKAAKPPKRHKPSRDDSSSLAA